jgi:Protein of unknown function (DUF2721)
MLEHYTLDDATHLIQFALTPVFLLSGIGALLSVFAGRLARVADQLAGLSTAIQSGGALAEQNEQLGLLRRRLLILDVAVVLATGGAAATCLAIMTLFLFRFEQEGDRERAAAVLRARGAVHAGVGDGVRGRDDAEQPSDAAADQFSPAPAGRAPAPRRVTARVCGSQESTARGLYSPSGQNGWRSKCHLAEGACRKRNGCFQARKCDKRTFVH